MITQRARLRRTAVGIGVAAVAVLGLGAPAPTAALDEFPPPVASVVDGYGPEALTYACDDETYSWTYLDGAVLVMLDRPADADLTVPIAYGGSLAGDLVEPVPDLVFAPGDDAQVVPFLFDELVDGDLTVSIEPGADHQLGIPASITFDVSSEPESVGDCEDDLGDPPGGTDRQTISVGEKPDPIGFFPESDDDEADDGPEDLVVPDAVADRVRVASRADVPSDFGYTTLAVGELPPGLAYADDVWSGAATTPGTYDFLVRLCLPDVPLTPEPVDGPAMVDVCLGQVDVQVVVEAEQSSTPPPAEPATPVVAPARLTG